MPEAKFLQHYNKLCMFLDHEGDGGVLMSDATGRSYYYYFYYYYYLDGNGRAEEKASSVLPSSN
jgi:hypothetical protein